MREKVAVEKIIRTLKNKICKYMAISKNVYIIAEGFIRTLKNKIYEYMTSVSKNVYIDLLDDTVNEFSNTYRTIKLKPVMVKLSTYINFNVENND